MRAEHTSSRPTRNGVAVRTDRKHSLVGIEVADAPEGHRPGCLQGSSRFGSPCPGHAGASGVEDKPGCCVRQGRWRRPIKHNRPANDGHRGWSAAGPAPGSEFLRGQPMWKCMTGLAVALVLLLAFLLAQSERRARGLEARLQALAAERKALAEQQRVLENRSRTLADEREGDRAVIGQLWAMIHGDGSKPTAEGPERSAPSYDIATLKAMLAGSGGNLNEVIHQVLTPERLAATLQRHATQPVFWAAAASMCADPAQALQYLETAAARFPDSPIAQASLIEAKRALPGADASTRAAIDRLREADPTSALADHYDAYFRFKEGDVAGALQVLAAASEKDRFADQRMELMMGRYQSLLESGCSDGAALALSAFSLPFDHLPMLREVSQQALLQAESAFASGDVASALQTVEHLARIGRNLSASGRFIVYDRLGMEVQQTALQAGRRFHASAGNAVQIGELDYQLGALEARAAAVNAMAEAFGGILATMTDADIVRYIDSTIMHGEFTTLQALVPGR